MLLKKFGSTLGLALGFFAIFGSFFFEGGTFSALFMLPALLIVFGGTFAAVIIGMGLDRFLNILPLMRLAYFPPQFKAEELIQQYYDISIKERQSGLLSVEKELEKFEHYFPPKMIRMVMDGTDANTLEEIATAEMRSIHDRHMANIQLFTKMGGYAPTMGIIGTVMGLIMTLANAGSDPNQLIRSIATAFIATLWGVFSANIIWLPVGDKLKQCHLEEKYLMEMALEGTQALLKGEIPSIVRARMLSLLPPKRQDQFLAA